MSVMKPATRYGLVAGLLIPLGIFLTVMSLLVSYNVYVDRTFPELHAVDSQIATQLGYTLSYAGRLSPDSDFTIRASDKLIDAVAQDKKIVTVYSDPMLTHEVPVSLAWKKAGFLKSFLSLNTITISPPATPVQADDMWTVDEDGDPQAGQGAPVTLAPAGRWTTSDNYYVVQTLDMKGNPVSTPQVTVFTVDDPSRLESTPLQVSLALDGSLDFSWAPVGGADYYRVLMITHDSAASVGDEYATNYTLVGTSTTTTLNSAVASGEAGHTPDDVGTNEWLLQWQNGLMQPFAAVVTEDELNDPSYSGQTENPALTTGLNFAVQPVAGTGADEHTGRLQETADMSDLFATVPYSVATYAWSQSQLTDHLDCSTPDADTCWQMIVPVTMVDGHTAPTIAIYDPDNIVPTSSGRGSYVPFCGQGTRMCSWTLRTEPPSLDLVEKVTAVNKQNLDRVKASGELPSFTYRDPGDLPKNAGVSTQPEVPYPVNGSTELVTFIAANLMAGNNYLDLTHFLTADPTVDIADALNEAGFQNPYVIFSTVCSISYSPTQMYLWVDFGCSGDDFKDSLPDYRKQLLDTGRSIVSSIITEGMSDRDKAWAINMWLVDNAEYDDAAFNSSLTGNYQDVYAKHPYAWNAIGTLMKTYGVCLSYAASYKLLADLAGLSSVLVIGDVPGGGHAWNKVYMDGKWQIVDSTWDDGSISPSDYFGFSDARAAQEHRTQRKEWMVDAFIGDYAAP